MSLQNLTDNEHDRTLHNPNLSQNRYLKNLVLLTLEHVIIDILSDPTNKDFTIFADGNLDMLIIKIGYGLTISLICCLNFLSAIHCYLTEHPSDSSPVYKRLDANNNANAEYNSDVLVVNLSQHALTESQKILLSRGLKFCPNPGEPDSSSYQADLDKFHLRIKRWPNFHKPKRMHNNTNSLDQTFRGLHSQSREPTPIHDEPFQHQSFKKTSAWQPPPIVSLEFFISKNKLDLVEQSIPPPGRNNISTEESKAIKQLANNPNIVIKPADKGGAVVIQDRSAYIKEGMRQLTDLNFYKEVDTDLSDKHHGEIIQILDEMFAQGHIDRSCYLYLSDNRIRTAQFYMLPEIHKNQTPPPGRPIVSGNGCPTERISKFIDHFLQPNVKNIRSYIKDTTDFLYMLNKLGNLPPNCTLVTLDVSSLYTNIPNIEGRIAAQASLDASLGGRENPSNDYLIKLLDKVLRCNNFDFNNRHFLQTGGTAMGTKVAPAYANTFMGWFEEKYVYTYRKQPIIWKRFIDDIFVIWQYSHDELTEFVSYLNTRMPSIKFEAEANFCKLFGRQGHN